MSDRPEEQLLFCGRCDRAVRRSFRAAPPQLAALRKWPEGWICSGCFTRACETYGRCSGCGVDRLVPGLAEDGTRLCTDCASLGDFTCTRCGEEGWRNGAGGVCGRCVLTDRLTTVLDDGGGQVRAELVPLFEALRRMPRPRSGSLWLSRPAPVGILRALATGSVALTHEGLNTLAPPKSVNYVRDLLIDSGVLPPVDRFLLMFELWLPGWLAAIEDTEHRRILQRFATWHILRQLRLIAAREPVGSYRANIARARLRAPAEFLRLLAGHDRTLRQCTQADVDRWFATATTAGRGLVRRFLNWCTSQREAPRLELPGQAAGSVSMIGQQQRLTLIRRMLIDDTVPNADRVVALLILLYAQPLGRIARLTIDDVLRSPDGEVFLRLGEPLTPVPVPFADVLARYVDSRASRCANPDSRLLFPGRHAGQPMHTTSLRLRLRRLAIPNIDGRTAAIRQMLRQAPAPVVAGMLGYAVASTEKIAAEAAVSWQHYAPGEHHTITTPTLQA